jgi:hypothetical protein
MGYPTVAQFDRVFVQRTKDILDGIFSNHEFTLQINCLLGLLILPNEYIKKKKLMKTDQFEGTIDSFQERIKKIFSEDEITLFQDEREFRMNKCTFWTNKGNKKNALYVPFSELLAKLRNSIAHFNIQPTRFNDAWDGVILENINKEKITTMKLYLTKAELKALVDFIIEKYEKADSLKQDI